MTPFSEGHAVACQPDTQKQMTVWLCHSTMTRVTSVGSLLVSSMHHILTQVYPMPFTSDFAHTAATPARRPSPWYGPQKACKNALSLLTPCKSRGGQVTRVDRGTGKRHPCLGVVSSSKIFRSTKHGIKNTKPLHYSPGYGRNMAGQRARLHVLICADEASHHTYQWPCDLFNIAVGMWQLAKVWNAMNSSLGSRWAKLHGDTDLRVKTISIVYGLILYLKVVRQSWSEASINDRTRYRSLCF